MSDKLGQAINEHFNEQDELLKIPLELIEIKGQLREEFEDADWTMDALTESIAAEGLHQPVLLRPSKDGYLLVCGERRFRACQNLGLALIPALVREMTDIQAEVAQASENIHHKSFTIIEEAKLIDRKIKRLGSVELAMKELGKSASWVSKRLSLLKLPEHTKKAVSEGLTADVEAINIMATIEQQNPALAKELIGELTANKGNQQSVRAKTKAVNDSLKVNNDKPAKVMKPLKVQDEHFIDMVRDCLGKAYVDIFEHKINANKVVAAFDKDVKNNITSYLNPHFNAGIKCKQIGHALVNGFRSGDYSEDGYRVFACIAFLEGATGKKQLNLLDVLSQVK